MPDEPRQFSRLAEELIGDFRQIPDGTPKGPRNIEGRRPDPRRAMRAAKPLSELMEALLVEHQIGRDSPEHTIREHWGEIVGPANAHYSHAAMIDARGKLTVHASHSVVRNELFHHRKLIVEKIQALPGCARVRALTLRAG